MFKYVIIRLENSEKILDVEESLKAKKYKGEL
jgi:hypothetical protein